MTVAKKKSTIAKKPAAAVKSVSKSGASGKAKSVPAKPVGAKKSVAKPAAKVVKSVAKPKAAEPAKKAVAKKSAEKVKAPAKPVAKPAAKTKPVVKKEASAAVSRKPDAKKSAPVAKEASAKKAVPAAPKSQAVASAPAKKANVVVAPPPEPVVAERPQTISAPKKRPVKPGKMFSKAELHEFKGVMVEMARRLETQIEELQQQSLLRHDEVNQDEDGTDAFERVISLDRASADQSVVFEINEALRAIEEGSYGLCDVCGNKIEKPRLQALPFVKTCIECQSSMEGGDKRRARANDLWD